MEIESNIEPELNPAREALWGLWGGLGGLVLLAAAYFIAWLNGESPRSLIHSPFPLCFYYKYLMWLDYYLFFILMVGFGFLAAGLLMIRFAFYPRTDGFYATLLGTICSSLAGIALFLRLWAVLH